MTKSPETMTTLTTSDLIPEPTSAASDQPQSSLFDLNKVALFNALTASGITQVVVSFDGYGDSGQIEDISYSNGDGSITMPECKIDILGTIWPEPEPRQSSISVASAIETLAYSVLEYTHCGWENNDGAYGDIIFDVAERTITLDYNERYTTSENFTHIL